MFLNPWSLALVAATVATLFLALASSYSAFRVLFLWDTGSDSERQIGLESEIWLSSSLIELGLVVQILSLLLLVLAAESYATVLAGAMCATGAFLANEWGMPAVIIKLVGLFFYGFWIVLHRLDLQSETMPLMRLKYFYLLSLLPLTLLDGSLVLLYVNGLEPDIITSCCGVLFGESAPLIGEFSGRISLPILVFCFYLWCGSCLLLLWYQLRTVGRTPKAVCFFAALSYGGFFVYAIMMIIYFFSSYIYAMPYHHCPFDILQSQYHGVGYPIYMCLIGATFLGMSASLVRFVQSGKGLRQPVMFFQRWAFKLSWWLLFFAAIFLSFFPCYYWFMGG